MNRIGTLHEIVANHQYQKMDGYLMDAFTAQMLIAVYEALDRPGGVFERKPELRERFDSIPLARLVDFGWKNTTRVEGAA